MKPGWLIAAAALAFLGCNREPDPVAGGWTDTETGTKISGVIREEGAAAAGARVSLRPADYLAKDPTQPDSSGPRRGAILDVVSDDEGRFTFDSVPQGEYLIEAVKGGRGALIPFGVEDNADDVNLVAAHLSPLGRIQGRVMFSDGAPGAALVRVYGLERAVLADPATGAFTVPDLPAGTLDLHVSGLEPFILPVRKSGVQVLAGLAADAGDVVLQRKLKQAFHVGDGRVSIPGVDSTNPVVFENGAFLNPVDGAYLWAQASRGRLDLRGTIVSYSKDTGEAALQRNLRNCLDLVRIARSSGMRGVVDPVAGARHKLAPAPSGRLEDILPRPTQGGLLLIQEAYRARPEKPLIVISAAGLTTVAEALLRDPAIANRMVIVGAQNDNVNNGDSLAAAVVARKARLVLWARDYYWSNRTLIRKAADVFPTHRLGEALRNQFLKDTSTAGHWAHSFFGDFGASTYLFNPRVWSSAQGAYFATPLVPSPFDYVDIPKAANDWSAMHEEFFAAITRPEAYHPFPAGRIPGGNYGANLRVRPDTAGGQAEAGAEFTGRGSWADYRIEVPSAGDWSVEIRYRTDVPAGIKVSDLASGLSEAGSLLPTVEPAQLTLRLPLEAGVRSLRLESIRAEFRVDAMTLSPR